MTKEELDIKVKKLEDYCVNRLASGEYTLDQAANTFITLHNYYLREYRKEYPSWFKRLLIWAGIIK